MLKSILEAENMRLVIKDHGDNEYQACTDTPGIDRILVI